MDDARRDDQRLWHTVSTTRQSLQDQAPEGYAARVEVYLLDGTMVVPGVVSSSLPWIYFESRENEDDLLTHRVVAVRAEQIARIEIQYVRDTKAPPGFRVEEASDSNESA